MAMGTLSTCLVPGVIWRLGTKQDGCKEGQDTEPEHKDLGQCVSEHNLELTLGMQPDLVSIIFIGF